MVKNQWLRVTDFGFLMYALVFGQCLLELMSKIKASTPYEQANINQDVIQLLKIVQGFCCLFDDHQQSMWALENVTYHVSMYYQTHNMNTMEYVKNFKALDHRNIWRSILARAWAYKCQTDKIGSA